MESVDTLVSIYSAIMVVFSILIVLISSKILYFEVFLDKSRFFKTLEAKLPSRAVTLLRITISAYLVLGALLFSYLVYHALTSPLEFKRSGYEMYERDPQLFLALVILGLLVVPTMFVGLIISLVRELAGASRRM
jgi:glucan phosphoethanolaminetransferase (alkaline phosphatase superfamily)